LKAHRRQVAHNTLVWSRPHIGHDADINQVAVLQAAAGEVPRSDEHDVTMPGNASEPKLARHHSSEFGQSDFAVSCDELIARNINTYLIEEFALASHFLE
jgi:hypothetical protein